MSFLILEEVVINDFIDEQCAHEYNDSDIFEPSPRIDIKEIGNAVYIIEELPDKIAPGFVYNKHEIKNANLMKVFKTLFEIDYLKNMTIGRIKEMYWDFIACHETGLRMFF